MQQSMHCDGSDMDLSMPLVVQGALLLVLIWILSGVVRQWWVESKPRRPGELLEDYRSRLRSSILRGFSVGLLGFAMIFAWHFGKHTAQIDPDIAGLLMLVFPIVGHLAALRGMVRLQLARRLVEP